MELPRSMPEVIPLYLPSLFPSEKRTAICIAGIDGIEDHLCFAQACEALVQLWTQLMKHTCASRYKSQDVESQRSYTCFHAQQEHTESKIKSSQIKYTVARLALFTLWGSGRWEDSLKVLHAEDIWGLDEHALRVKELDTNRCMQKLAGLEATGSYLLEGICSLLAMPLPSMEFISGLAVGEEQWTLSWIWYSTTGEELGCSETEACPSFQVCLCLHSTNWSWADSPDLHVEWLHCWARAARWKEEIELLNEEMCCSIQFCKWKMRWWDSQKGHGEAMQSHTAEGLWAYAAEQLNAEHHCMASWASHWTSIQEWAVAILEGCLTGDRDVMDSDRPLKVLQIEIENEDEDEDLDQAD